MNGRMKHMCMSTVKWTVEWTIESGITRKRTRSFLFRFSQNLNGTLSERVLLFCFGVSKQNRRTRSDNILLPIFRTVKTFGILPSQTGGFFWYGLGFILSTVQKIWFYRRVNWFFKNQFLELKFLKKPKTKITSR